MNGNDLSRKLWWAVPSAAVLLLFMLIIVFSREREPPGHGTSYDASSRGFRAAYLLLEELGYPVARVKQLGGQDVRLLLFPKADAKEAARLAAWVKAGGIVILADDSEAFAGAMGIRLKVRALESAPNDEAATGLDALRLAGGPTLVEWPGAPGRLLVQAGDHPFVTVHPFGEGEVWLVNRPEFLTNRLLRQDDNAVLLCRLAEAALERRPGRIGFDEYFHGLRERPGVTTLLFSPPALWVTLHGLLLLGLLLWQYAPRFGTVKAAPALSRRSKEEFLDAMASLLERKRDYADAFATVRDEFARELEHELGLPPGTPPDQLVLEAARRRPVSRRLFLRLLNAESLPAGAGPTAFVKALNEMEMARDEFHGRRSR